MEKINIIESKAITDNSKVVLLTIGGVKYAFTEAPYNLFYHLLPRNFFYNNIKIREDVKSAIETLSETDIQKVYSLLLEVTQMPNTYPY